MIRDENVYTYLIQSNTLVSMLTAEPSFSVSSSSNMKEIFMESCH